MAEFWAETKKSYGFAYSINPNFLDEMSNSTKNNWTNYINFPRLEMGGVTIDMDDQVILTETTSAKYDLQGNEVMMRYDMFNNWFGGVYGTYTEENYATEFEPVTFKVHHTDGTADRNVIYTVDMTIKQLLPTSDSGYGPKKFVIYTKNQELMEMAGSRMYYTFGYYLDDASQLDKIYDIIENNPYVIESRVYESISLVGYIVGIFEDLFWLLLLSIGGVSVLLLVSYAYGNIKKRYYEIGVLKAIGATTKSVGFVFGLQTVLAGLVISILSSVMLITLCSPINTTISNKLLEFINNSNLSEISIISVNIPTIVINVGVILLVTMASCIIPLIKLNKIKPKNIIASDE